MRSPSCQLLSLSSLSSSSSPSSLTLQKIFLPRFGLSASFLAPCRRRVGRTDASCCIPVSLSGRMDRNSRITDYSHPPTAGPVTDTLGPSGRAGWRAGGRATLSFVAAERQNSKLVSAPCCHDAMRWRQDALRAFQLISRRRASI